MARAQGMRAAAMYVHSFLCGGGSSGRSNDGGGQQQEWRQRGGRGSCDVTVRPTKRTTRKRMRVLHSYSLSPVLFESRTASRHIITSNTHPHGARVPPAFHPGYLQTATIGCLLSLAPRSLSLAPLARSPLSLALSPLSSRSSHAWSFLCVYVLVVVVGGWWCVCMALVDV